jgi:triphosphoribosyl-dephospho-CoA synthetase
MAKTNNSTDLAERFRQAAATRGGYVHIVPSKSGWSVKKEGNLKATAVRKTKEDAVKVARTIQSADRIIVHKKDGTIQKNTAKR